MCCYYKVNEWVIRIKYKGYCCSNYYSNYFEPKGTRLIFRQEVVWIINTSELYWKKVYTCSAISYFHLKISNICCQNQMVGLNNEPLSPGMGKILPLVKKTCFH